MLLTRGGRLSKGKFCQREEYKNYLLLQIINPSFFRRFNFYSYQLFLQKTQEIKGNTSRTKNLSRLQTRKSSHSKRLIIEFTFSGSNELDTKCVSRSRVFLTTFSLGGEVGKRYLTCKPETQGYLYETQGQMSQGSVGRNDVFYLKMLQVTMDYRRNLTFKWNGRNQQRYLSFELFRGLCWGVSGHVRVHDLSLLLLSTLVDHKQIEEFYRELH